MGDAGELLDDQAKRAYRNRLSELREELEEAKALGKSETAEHLEEEIAALTGELSRAVGLRGRSRRAASASERARQTVGKVIRAAVGRIAQSDPHLGEILSRSIKTGVFCSYRPDERLLGAGIAEALFTEVLAQARRQGLLSTEHFTVDGR